MSRPQLSSELVEQLILTAFELADRLDHVGAVRSHRVGVRLRLAEVVACAGCLCHQGSDLEVAGVVGEMRQLVVDHAQLVAKAAQAGRDLPKAAFHESLSHGRQCREPISWCPSHQPRWQAASMDDEWGITDGYHDVFGTWHHTTDETRTALRRSMGDPDGGARLWFVREGDDQELTAPCSIRLEDGALLGPLTRLPHDLPIGYHDLEPADGTESTRLIVHPARCPELPRAWGVAVQVYALWSAHSWGIGDLRDLATLAESVVAAGGSALLVSPLHQSAPSLPVEPSPYYPSSRRAWSPLLLAMDGSPPDELRCSPDELIDRDAVWAHKRAVLEARFDELDSAMVEAIVPDSVAWWNARNDVFGADWRAWPGLAHVPDPVLHRLARFHQWLQSLVGEQLAAVRATGVRLIGDLAVGFSPDGADAAEYGDLVSADMRIGAPPDEFNTAGQDWGIPPFIPWRLRAAGYQPFIDTVRAALRGVDALRIDHAMGLFRQYWVPVGSGAAEGGYVRFPADELLAIICLEATRAGAFVIGEDLGTVEPEVRAALAERRIACTKVLYFESDPPAAWPEECLATITTHDLPTAAAVFDRVDGDESIRDRLVAMTPSATTADEAIEGAHAAMLGSPARLRLLSADDLCASRRRPNLPGRNDYPSWRIRLPFPADELL